MKSSDKKISSNKIDQSPSMFGYSNDPKAYAIDPSAIRLVGGSTQFLTSRISSGSSIFSTGFVVEAEESVNDGSLANLIPKLEDISIKSMVLDYSTNPVSVKLILRIKNSTGYPVKGISGRIPKK
jgi:hypothetical protein